VVRAQADPTVPLKPQVVHASWYGSEFAQRPTASGEPFDPYKLTCAHRTLPLGTRLRVTNLDNGRSVLVTINDRGPYFPPRELDLSYGAARALGMVRRGVARVRIEVVES
jgi:rare lipoprotein A